MVGSEGLKSETIRRSSSDLELFDRMLPSLESRCNKSCAVLPNLEPGASAARERGPDH